MGFDLDFSLRLAARNLLCWQWSSAFHVSQRPGEDIHTSQHIVL